MHTVQILRHLIEHNEVWAYCIIFLGLIFEGEVILICTGILMSIGAIDIPLALTAVFAGSITKTLYCYYLGAHIRKHWHRNKFVRYINRRVHYIMPHFERDPFWSIFLSKFIMWMNFSVIVYSGYKKIDWRTYIKAELLSTIIWAPLLLILGYFFSFTALHISREVGHFLFISGSFILGFIILDRLAAVIYTISENLANGNGEKDEE
ncbi:MAG TPA: VTT domain-containing protein [Candidatus Paceibacterota bacterium]|jgi:membrane protein DedA with SNARE-associated domain|nr:VTT domain-containing protein [Candidatus Paceibacterota bacterium]